MLALSIALTLLPFLGSAQVDTYAFPNPHHIPLAGPVHLQARDVTVHIMTNVHLRVHSVDALLLPTAHHPRVVLDDPESMSIRLESAETSISAEDLSTLVNNYTLPRSKLPIHDLSITFSDGTVLIKGKVHKLLVDLPFSASAPISITPSGDIHLHFSEITAVGFLHKGLLDFLGINISDLAKTDRNRYFRVDKDDVTFPIHALFPAPHFTGHLKSATVNGDRLDFVFGIPHPFAPAPEPAMHYVYLRGGSMSLGRINMLGVDLEIVHKQSDESFDFSLQHIFEQVLPGYLRSRADHGLTAYVESFHDTDQAEEHTPAGPD